MSDEPSDPRETVSYDPETDAYYAEYDVPDSPPSVVVVEAIATIRGLEPSRMAPIYGTLDPDALDGLFVAAETSRSGGVLEVTFAYCDCDVTVRRGGRIRIDPPDGGEPSGSSS